MAKIIVGVLVEQEIEIEVSNKDLQDFQNDELTIQELLNRIPAETIVKLGITEQNSFLNWLQVDGEHYDGLMGFDIKLPHVKE